MEELNIDLNNEKEETQVGMNLENGVSIDLETPEVDNKNEFEILAELQPARFSAFNKILSFLSQGLSAQDIFYINQGKLTSAKSAGIVYSDMSDLFGENNIEIVDPANAVKLLNLIKGGDKVLFSKDNTENNYVISTIIDNEPERIVTIPVPEFAETDIIKIPELTEIKSFEIDPIEIEDIINAFKITGADFYILHFNDDFELLSIELNNKKFKQNIKKGKSTKKYKIFDLMMISKPDTFKIKISEDKEKNLWVSTISDIDIVEIYYFEKLQEYSKFEAFTL